MAKAVVYENKSAETEGNESGVVSKQVRLQFWCQFYVPAYMQPISLNILLMFNWWLGPESEIICA